MADLDRVAVRVSDGLRNTLSRVSTLALGIAAGTFLVGLATFATGWWVSDGSPAWIVIGGTICFIPTAAALLAWFYVRCTVNVAPALLDNVRTVLTESRSKGPHAPAADVLIDYDTGEPLTSTAKSFEPLRVDLQSRRRDLPALYFSVRAVTAIPRLAAIALLGTLAVGALGTVLLIAGLIA
jgi:hypothetical protein